MVHFRQANSTIILSNISGNDKHNVQCQIYLMYSHLVWNYNDRKNFAYVVRTVVDTNNYFVDTDYSWCLDSRASHHMTSSTEAMQDIQQYKDTISIVIGDGKILKVTHRYYNINIPKWVVSRFAKTLCVPCHHKNLISLQKHKFDYLYEFTLKSNVFFVKNT